MTDDIKALVTELREVKPTWDAARRAADTIEALEAENESLRITLAARDRRDAAEALRSASSLTTDDDYVFRSTDDVRDWLRARADQIESP